MHTQLMSLGGSELVSMQTFDIAQKLQNRLPKELRILIYQHYWDFGRSDEFRAAEIFYFHGVSKSLPAYILPSFVGIDIAREAVVEFFRCMILSEPGDTGMQVLLRDIDRQLWRDAFNVGITRGSTVRNLCIFSSNCLRLHDVNNYLGVEDNFLSQQNMDRTRQNLKSLLNPQLNINTRIRLYVDLSTSVLDLECILDILRDVYFLLKQRGIKIIVWIDRTRHQYEWLGNNPNAGYADYYDTPLDVWRHHYGFDRAIEVFVPHCFC